MAVSPRPRIFLGLLDICGVYRSLEIALTDLGFDAYFLNLGREHRPVVRRESVPARAYKYWIHQSVAPTGVICLLPPAIRRLMLKLSILLLVGWISWRFDVVLLKSGGTLTSSGAEIAWLKRRGKTVVFSFHGSDSRPDFLNPKEFSADTWSDVYGRMAKRHEKIMKGATFADYIIDSPTSAHWQAKRCCMRQVIFSPAPLYAFSKMTAPTTSKSRVRVIHCPSNRELKGTEVIRAVVKRLQNEGRDIDYVELVNVPNARVVEELHQSDIAIDQMYADNYGGIFALEAMTAGTPVVVGGYARKELDRFVPEWARAPTNYTHPDDLYETVRELVDNRGAREASQLAVKRYIGEVVAPIESARRFIRLVNGEAPAEWFFDPKDIRYACGAAGPAWKVCRNIRQVVDASGPEGLLLDDKPELRDFLVATAAEC